MNCDLQTNIDRLKKSAQGGVDTVYLFAFSDYNFSQITTVEQELTVFPATTLYDVYSTVTNYTETSEPIGGDVAWNQTLTLQFPRTAKTSQIFKLAEKDYRAIYIDRIGNIRILGLWNGLEGVITNETGTEKPELNGYRVTFSGQEDNQAYFLNDIEDVGFIINTITNFVYIDGCNLVFISGDNFILL